MTIHIIIIFLANQLVLRNTQCFYPKTFPNFPKNLGLHLFQDWCLSFRLIVVSFILLDYFALKVFLLVLLASSVVKLPEFWKLFNSKCQLHQKKQIYLKHLYHIFLANFCKWFLNRLWSMHQFFQNLELYKI